MTDREEKILAVIAETMPHSLTDVKKAYSITQSFDKTIKLLENLTKTGLTVDYIEGMTVLFTDDRGVEKECKVIDVQRKGLESAITLEEI